MIFALRSAVSILWTQAASIQEYFADLSDPRRRKVTYPLINIVTMALCAVMSGADDFVAIADWAETKKEWLATFLDVSFGEDQCRIRKGHADANFSLSTASAFRN